MYRPYRSRRILAQCLGDAQGLIEPAILQQNPEFVAAQARERIADSNPGLQHAGDLLEQLVPGGVTASIVDQLELIQVEVQQRVAAIRVLPHGLDRGGQPIFEFAAVDEPGERIVARLIMQRPVQPALLAHIVKHHHRADQITGTIADGRRRILDRDFLSAAVHEHRVFGQAEHLSFAQAAHDRTLARLPRRLIDDRQHIADQLRLRFAVFPSGQALGHRIHVVDASFGIGGDYRIADRLQA